MVRKIYKKDRKRCGGVLIPDIKKFKRRPCERCYRFTPGEEALVEQLVYNEKAQAYTCQYWII